MSPPAGFFPPLSLFTPGPGFSFFLFVFFCLFYLVSIFFYLFHRYSFRLWLRVLFFMYVFVLLSNHVIHCGQCSVYQQLIYLWKKQNQNVAPILFSLLLQHQIFVGAADIFILFLSSSFFSFFRYIITIYNVSRDYL